MRTRIWLVTVLWVVAVLSGGSTACGSILSELGIRPSRLAALAARQDLLGNVAVATADGRLDRGERAEILAKARSVLKPQEYSSFKRALDNRWLPTKKPSTWQSATTVRNQPKSARPTEARRPIDSATGLVIPTGALLPD